MLIRLVSLLVANQLLPEPSAKLRPKVDAASKPKETLTVDPAVTVTSFDGDVFWSTSMYPDFDRDTAYVPGLTCIAYVQPSPLVASGWESSAAAPPLEGETATETPAAPVPSARVTAIITVPRAGSLIRPAGASTVSEETGVVGVI
ncbi:hypothetical protein FVQ89_04315 [Homoserinibacter sp. GY 40078]|nr:hypothetical protein FVQ89_04315 [Homoserinibacter sp. GY 40078]